MNTFGLIRFSLAYLLYIIVAVFFLLEVTFRILPTTSPVDLQIISDKKDILRFYPNQKGKFSLGTNFYKVVDKKTNNYGFYSNYDYFPNAEPNIIIIGDSFVQAAQIRNQDTVGEIMQSEHTGLKVYQLGVSGVSLPQYIKMIKYAEREFSPQHYVVVIVGNDFDESLCKYAKKAGTWCFNDDFELEFRPFFGFHGFRNFIRKSAAVRYFVFQLGLDWREMLAMIKGEKNFNLSRIMPKIGWWGDQNKSSVVSQYAGNTKRFKSDEITSMSRDAITIFFQKLSNMDLLDKVTIVIDADREDIYKDRVTFSYFNEMRRFMINEAYSLGVDYLDMDYIFRNDFKINNKKFEHPTDEHWNEHAHKLLSKILFNEYSVARK